MLLLLSLSLIADLFAMGGTPHVVEHQGAYEKIVLTDSTSLEIYENPDTYLVVMTACAPQCSSCACVYNKEWKPLQTLTPPFTSIFPLATINKETGAIEWTDNDTWNYQSTL
jgi:hypothetical protein